MVRAFIFMGTVAGVCANRHMRTQESIHVKDSQLDVAAESEYARGTALIQDHEGSKGEEVAHNRGRNLMQVDGGIARRRRTPDWSTAGQSTWGLEHLGQVGNSDAAKGQCVAGTQTHCSAAKHGIWNNGQCCLDDGKYTCTVDTSGKDGCKSSDVTKTTAVWTGALCCRKTKKERQCFAGTKTHCSAAQHAIWNNGQCCLDDDGKYTCTSETFGKDGCHSSAVTKTTAVWTGVLCCRKKDTVGFHFGGATRMASDGTLGHGGGMYGGGMYGGGMYGGGMYGGGMYGGGYHHNGGYHNTPVHNTPVHNGGYHNGGMYHGGFNR